MKVKLNVKIKEGKNEMIKTKRKETKEERKGRKTNKQDAKET